MKRLAEEECGGVKKQSRLNQKELYKEPTLDELHRVSLGKEMQSSSLSQADLLQIQVKDLLREVSIKNKKVNLIKEYVDDLIGKLKNIAPGEGFKLHDRTQLKSFRVRLPLGFSSPERGHFRFRPPEEVHVIGSFATGTCARPDVHVDLAVQLPQGFVHANDRINQVYLYKRALYLMYIAEHILKDKKSASDLFFRHHQGNHVKPVLVIKPTGRLSGVEIRLHTYFEEHHVRRSQLHVDRCNLRPITTHENHDEPVENEDEGDTEGTSTPHYNTWLLQDMAMKQHATLVDTYLARSPGLQQGIHLLKIWLRNRQLTQGYGAMNGHVITMFLVYLVQQGKIDPLMAPLQVFRATLNHLAEINWHNNGISLCVDLEGVVKLAPFHRHFSVVFVDDTGTVNLCADMSVSTLLRVRREAQLGLQFLDEPSPLRAELDILFLKKRPFLDQFDHIVQFETLPSAAVNTIKLSDKVKDHCGHEVHACTDALLALVQRGIGHRLTLLGHSITESAQWPVIKKAPKLPDGWGEWRLGLLLNETTAFNVLERGPSADAPEAKEFREFWGERSELRRFHDASVCEAVLWQADTLQEKRAVVETALKYFLQRHAGLTDMHVWGGELDSLLKQREALKPIEEETEEVPTRKAKTRSGTKKLHSKKKKEKKPIILKWSEGTGEENFSAHAHALSEFVKILRKLQMPLKIQAAHCVDPGLRYTEVLPVKLPVPAYALTTKTDDDRYVPRSEEKVPAYVPIHTVYCMLEGSSKWPDDLHSVQRMKAAFLLQMAQHLRGRKQITTHEQYDHLDVNYMRYTFRLRIGYSHEINLLRTSVESDGRVNFGENPASHELQMQLHTMRQLSSTVVGLHHQYPSLSVGIRLAKRWVAGHMMLGDHVSHEVIELIVISLYLNPEPNTPPGSPLTCFLRFLQFMASFNWRTQPLFVNLTNEFKAEAISALQTNFKYNRAVLPVMCIATPFDRNISFPWAREMPCAPVLTRLAQLARSSYDSLLAQLNGPQTSPTLDYKMCFRPTLDVFDVLIWLKPSLVSRGYQALDVHKDFVIPICSGKSNAPPPVSSFDPVERYITDLKEAFGRVALFFRDCCGGRVVAMLWRRPHASQGIEFSEEAVNFHIPDTTSSEVRLVPDVESIIYDLELMGQGLVESITKHTHNWPF